MRGARSDVLDMWLGVCGQGSWALEQDIGVARICRVEVIALLQLPYYRCCLGFWEPAAKPV